LGSALKGCFAVHRVCAFAVQAGSGRLR
jgi:hypothetical protein